MNHQEYRCIQGSPEIPVDIRAVKDSYDGGYRLYNGDVKLDIVLAAWQVEERPLFWVRKVDEKTPQGPPMVNRWRDLPGIEGYWIDEKSELRTTGPSGWVFTANDRNIYATENQALSALAMAQLSQLMAYVNEGWTPDWSNTTQRKFVIWYDRGEIYAADNIYSGAFLTFPNSPTRDQFLKDHRALIEEYFLMYK